MLSFAEIFGHTSAFQRTLLEFGRQIGRRHRVFIELGRRDLIECDRKIQVSFANVHVCTERRQRDVGQHAPLLSAMPVGAIELLHCNFQGTQIRWVRNVCEQLSAQIQQALYRPFSVSRFVSDDDASPVILNGTG